MPRAANAMEAGMSASCRGTSFGAGGAGAMPTLRHVVFNVPARVPQQTAVATGHRSFSAYVLACIRAPAKCWRLQLPSLG